MFPHCNEEGKHLDPDTIFDEILREVSGKANGGKPFLLSTQAPQTRNTHRQRNHRQDRSIPLDWHFSRLLCTPIFLCETRTPLH
jgi:hypothetical protein